MNQTDYQSRVNNGVGVEWGLDLVAEKLKTTFQLIKWLLLADSKVGQMYRCCIKD